MEAELSKHAFKKPGILRTGFEYQDLIGIEFLLEYYRDPDRYLWVEIESENPQVGYLDDVVAARNDGTFALTQVKFTADPELYFLDWDWLLAKKPKGTSRLYKWAESLSRVKSLGAIHKAELRTNRRPSEDFGEALVGNRINLAKLSKDIVQKVESELGGTSKAADFFATFEFSHSEPLIDQLESKLMASVVPTDTDSSGWLWLRDQVRRWATRKGEPQPDGRITHRHLVQAITKKRAQPIPQDFQVPSVYCLPDENFHKDFVNRITNENAPISILWGTPGRGKSTYLSYVIEELRRDDIPVIRHHYFLSLDDTTSDRISFSDIATSLMDQIVNLYPDAVRGMDETVSDLRKWLEACGAYFAEHSGPLVVVVDGLDHVWRELSDIAQMNHLFNRLLPCPPNVTLLVGSQKVSDEKLPFRLIQESNANDWIQVPAMGEASVQAWVVGQHEAGRVSLPSSDLRHQQESEYLGELGAAFFEISSGHPLHLIYSFEELVRRGAVFTPDEIRALPECPDGDIQKYYAGLWGRLDAKAKQIVHLIAGSDFHWPPPGIRRCIGPTDDIDHLLEHRRSGLIPFHGSILSFARDDPNHQASFASMLPRIISWLEHDADEYRRWGWLWLMEAKNGNYSQLLEKTTRAWVAESLGRGWPYEQIVTILSAAEKKAFADLDYSKTIRLRSLKTRVQNGADYQVDNFAGFQEKAIRFSGNTQQVLNLADRISTLSDSQVISLARCTTEEYLDVLDDCINEIRRRVNLWISLRHRPSDEFVSLTERYLEVLSLAPQIEMKTALKFLGGFKEPDKLLRFFISCLCGEGRFEALVEIADNLKKQKKKSLHQLAQKAMVRVAAMQGINLAERHKPKRSPVAGLMWCWHYFHKSSARIRLAIPDIPGDIVREHYDYGRNDDLESFYEDIFFHALAVQLAGQKESSLIPIGNQSEDSRFINKAARLLEKTASQIAKGESQLVFATPYYAARQIEAVDVARPSDAEISQYRAFTHALRRIAIDLHLLKSPVGKTPRIRLEELAAARTSAHWSEAAWISEQVDEALPILKPEAAKNTLDYAVSSEAAHITPFNERAEKWTELSGFALLYGIEGAGELVARASNCIIGYGWRKDLWIIEILESIGAVHEHGGRDGLRWLRTLVPIIDQITEFTDGDETDHARSELIDLVATVRSDRLPDFYAHHTAQNEYRYAENALAAHCKLIDFSHPINVALAHTFIERQDIAVLRRLGNQGDSQARNLEIEQVRFLGGSPKDRDSWTSDNEELGWRGTPPDVCEFGPSEFPKLIERTSDSSLGYEHQRECLRKWLYHWKDEGMGMEAIASVGSYFEKEENPREAESLLDHVFLVSLELQGKKAAYDWIVRAHIYRHGWARYWTSEDETMRRLGWAAEYYKDDWAQFIRDTSRPARYWERRGGSFTIGIGYLVQYLLLVDQLELASEYVDTCVNIMVDEVSDQPIPDCGWFQ